LGAGVSAKELIGYVGEAIDVAGVAIIGLGFANATVMFAVRYWRRRRPDGLYSGYRYSLGRAILLGLELLVGGDIIRTVAVSPTFASVGVLALIVVVRTFLSFSLEVEITGRWPWQSGSDPPAQQQHRPEE
jgi:uncharacterized membrane protein